MTIEPERVVLVLSGGGMKAMAQVGVLRAMDEAGLTPSEIVGTSAGALVGALVASGLSYEEIVPRVFSVGRHELASLARWSVLARGLGAPSVLRPEPMRALLRRLLPAHSFAALRLPLRIAAVDADAGELVVFGAGGRTDCTVVEAVMASMALPLYLPPVSIDGRRFVDGGLLAVLPLEIAAPIAADLVVAVDVGPVAAAPPALTPLGPALLAAHDRAMAIVMASQRARAVAAWRSAERRPPLVLVEPEVDPYGTFAFDRTGEFIEAGYRAGHAALAGRGRGDRQPGPARERGTRGTSPVRGAGTR
ncbi:MAG TPA: patatin-like phospholipase family protein [Gemmatimonadales bacterium]|nr:patatin-like phospholipase family protein [Gemmatimonadales bacterium]